MRPTDSAGALAVLQRIRTAPRPDQGADERCEMCSEPIAAEHSHVVNVAARELLCACRGCYLLFTAQDAALRYRAVPDRHLSFQGFVLSGEQWDDLQIPVSVAFFFVNSQLGQTVGVYPSPAGATESELPLHAWTAVVEANPALRTLLPDVEAVLVRVTPEAAECFLVPIDRCYELVGHLRTLWRGFDGGQDVHRRLDAFFDDVRRRSRAATA